jgi:hypothetical protein
MRVPLRYALTSAAELALELGSVSSRGQLAWRAILRAFFEIGPRRTWRVVGVAGGLLVHAAIIDVLLGLGIFPS